MGGVNQHFVLPVIFGALLRTSVRNLSYKNGIEREREREREIARSRTSHGETRDTDKLLLRSATYIKKNGSGREGERGQIIEIVVMDKLKLTPSPS